MNKHSVLPPSSAARRMACPGSRLLESRQIQSESEAAIEGTLAHQVAAYELGLATCDPQEPPPWESVTDEMIEGAKLYVETIESITTSDTLEFIEDKLDISNIHRECWGTVDFWSYDPVTGRLNIVDYKFGHRYVDAYENWQLIAYAAGALQFLNRGKAITNIVDVEVNLIIIQPRCYHVDGPVRTWSMNLEELEPYFEALRVSEALAMGNDAPCKPNPECTFCKARHVCPALQRAATKSLEVASHPSKSGLIPEQLGAELRLLKHAHRILDARITGLEEEAIHHIRSGQTVANFKLEHSAGREQWTVATTQVQALGEMFGVSVLKEPTTITPRQAIKAGIPESAAMPYVARNPGSAKLVEISLKKSRKIFDNKSSKY